MSSFPRKRESSGVSRISALGTTLDARLRGHELLDGLVEKHGLSMAEVVRTAIRRWASEDRQVDDPVLA